VQALFWVGRATPPGRRAGRVGAVMLRVLAVAVAAAAGLLAAGPHAASAASSTAATELAQRYAPIVVLKTQAKPCDTHGEAYEPVAVDLVLNRADVTLRGPDGFTLQAPAARDPYRKGSGFLLDFPATR
jgi:hypothetical protein